MLVLAILTFIFIPAAAWYPPNCGKVSEKLLKKFGNRRSSISKRFIGGQDVDARDIPFVVRIDQNGEQVCTGSLLSRMHVLTAGHCFTTKRNDTHRCSMVHDQFTVCFLTSVNTKGSCPAKNTYRIKEFRNTEKYLKSNCNPYYDTIVVELSRDIETTDFVPVCLPLADNKFYENHNYKKHDVINVGYSDNQNYLDHPVNTHLKIVNAGKPQFCNDNSMLCTKQRKESAMCGGDSGSPMLQFLGDRAIIIGLNIASHGICNLTEWYPSKEVPLNAQFQKANIVARFAAEFKDYVKIA